MPVKVCGYCKCGFTTAREHAKTCSGKCRKALIRRNAKLHQMRQDRTPSLFGQMTTEGLIEAQSRNAEFDSRDQSLDAPL